MLRALNVGTEEAERSSGSTVGQKVAGYEGAGGREGPEFGSHPVQGLGHLRAQSQAERSGAGHCLPA